MRARHVFYVSCALFCAAACAPSSFSAAVAEPDVVAADSGLTLGAGWYRRETFEGRPFHWANNDVQIVIHSPQGDLKKIAVEIQGGPGLENAQNFVLHLRDASNRDIAVVHVPGTKTVRFDVPVQVGKDETVKLHVDGGGKRISSDPRTLNFRVFSIADASADQTLGAGHPDIASGGVKLGGNWYPLEEYGGETFRWVANDAKFTVNDSKDEQRRIEIAAAGGPAVKNPGKWTLSLEDAGGKLINKTQIKARGTAYFEIPLHSGENGFTLHVESTGAKISSDARTLSFRVFNIALD